MAAFRKADSDNYEKLRQAFPLTWRELMKRYNALGGLLEGEGEPEVVWPHVPHCNCPNCKVARMRLQAKASREELPKTILGRKVIVKEAGPRHLNMVLGSFNDYDHRLEEEEPDGTKDTGN